MLIDGFTGSFGAGDCIGLVGPNGCGKSSLLEAVAGLIPLDSGHIETAPPHPTTGYLKQIRAVPQTWTVGEAVRQLTGVASAEGRLVEAAAALATDDSHAAAVEYDQALTNFSNVGGGSIEDRAPTVLHEVGLTLELDRPCRGLSGGELARLNLAAILLSQFDVLLLDEPTNDLDGDGLKMLADFVTSRREPVLLVSHDRAFLRQTITGVVEFDPALAKVVSFAGGFDAWQRERERARQSAIDADQRYSEEVSRLREQADAARRSSARGTGAANRAYSEGRADKLQRGAMREGASAAGSSAARVEREIARMEQPTQLRKIWQLNLDFPAKSPSARVITAEAARVSRGGFELGPVDLSIAAGSRVRIVGRNGSGKSLLLDLLASAMSPDSGRVTGSGGGSVGLMNQERSAVPRSEAKLIDWFPTEANRELTDSRTLMAKFGLDSDDINRPMSTLSQGERTRVNLALLSARSTDVLILDEPTNHLDLPAIEQLEQALNRYSGTLILVTHDEQFASSVQLDLTFDVS